MDMWRGLSQEVLEGNLGDVPTNKRKKIHDFLRVTSMNNQWGKVVKLVNIEFKAAA
ncbi:MAG: hypothetical protein ORN54_14875 [Cyclobacteriaceae bacterium]|nr:hypothetical protein [Cyclobacteriaceae bacterium]